MAALALSKRVDSLEPLANVHVGEVEETVYGVVDKINDDGTPNFIRKWKGTIGNMRPTDEEPSIFVIEKLEPAILKHRSTNVYLVGELELNQLWLWMLWLEM